MNKDLEFILLSAQPADFDAVLELVRADFLGAHQNLSLHVTPQGHGIRFIVRGQVAGQHTVWNWVNPLFPEKLSAAFVWTAAPRYLREDRGRVAGSHLFYLLIAIDEGRHQIDVTRALLDIAKERLVEVFATSRSKRSVDDVDRPIGHYSHLFNQQEQLFVHNNINYIALLEIKARSRSKIHWSECFLDAADIRERFYKTVYPVPVGDARKDMTKLFVEIVPADVMVEGDEYLQPAVLLKSAVSAWRVRDNQQRGMGVARVGWWREQETESYENLDVEIPCAPVGIFGRTRTGKSCLASHIVAFAAKTRVCSGKPAPLRVIYLNYKGADREKARGIEEIQHLAYAWDAAFGAPIRVVPASDIAGSSRPDDGSLLYAEIGGEYQDVLDQTAAIILSAGKWEQTIIVFDEIINFCKRHDRKFSLVAQLPIIVDNDSNKKVFPFLVGQQLDDFELPELGSFRDVATIILTALDNTSANERAFKRICEERKENLCATEVGFSTLTGKYSTGAFYFSTVVDSKYAFAPAYYPTRGYPADAPDRQDRLKRVGLRPPRDFSWQDFLNVSDP